MIKNLKDKISRISYELTWKSALWHRVHELLVKVGILNETITGAASNEISSLTDVVMTDFGSRRKQLHNNVFAESKFVKEKFKK